MFVNNATTIKRDPLAGPSIDWVNIKSMHSNPCKIIVCFTYLIFSWTASKVIGPSDVYPSYGDICNTWASKPRISNDYIEVS